MAAHPRDFLRKAVPGGTMLTDQEVNAIMWLVLRSFVYRRATQDAPVRN